MLTDAQRKLVEENHNLIYSFMKSRNLAASDFYDICAIGLCKAAQKYNPKRAHFSVMAYRVMANEVSHQYSYSGCEKRGNHAVNVSFDNSLDQTLKSYDDYSDCEFESDIEGLTDREKKLLRLHYKYGYTYAELAKVYKCSPQNLSQTARDGEEKLLLMLTERAAKS